jgi:hypothetical protein
MDQKSRGSFALPEGFMERFRNWYDGVIILAGGMTKENLRSFWMPELLILLHLEKTLLPILI